MLRVICVRTAIGLGIAVVAYGWWRRRRASISLFTTRLNYVRSAPPGKRVGRNIGKHDRMADDLVDVHDPTAVHMGDARRQAFRFEREGFELRHVPSSVSDFKDEASLKTF